MSAFSTFVYGRLLLQSQLLNIQLIYTQTKAEKTNRIIRIDSLDSASLLHAHTAHTKQRKCTQNADSG